MTSSFTTGAAQADGRVFVRELIIDDFFAEHIAEYLAAGDFDFSGALAARVAGLVAILKQREIDRVLGNLNVWTWTYNSNTEMATAFRAEYLTSKSRRTAELARWLMDGLDSLVFPDTGTRQIFGLSVANWTTLKTKMGVLRTKLNDVEAAAGE